MLSVIEVPVPMVVPALLVEVTAWPMNSLPLLPCTPLYPGRAGMPPPDGVPKSVKTEKIWWL